MNGEEDKYHFPETLNQQERYFGLPFDEVLIVAPLIILGVLNDMSLELSVVAGLLWALIRHLKKGRGRTGCSIFATGIYLPCYSKLLFNKYLILVSDTGELN